MRALLTNLLFSNLFARRLHLISRCECTYSPDMEEMKLNPEPFSSAICASHHIVCVTVRELLFDSGRNQELFLGALHHSKFAFDCTILPMRIIHGMKRKWSDNKSVILVCKFFLYRKSLDKFAFKC